MDLGTDRQLGMAVGPIPWSSIDRWGRRHGCVDPDEFDDLVAIIRAVDSVYLDEAEKRAKKPAKKPAGGQGGK